VRLDVPFWHQQAVQSHLNFVIRTGTTFPALQFQRQQHPPRAAVIPRALATSAAFVLYLYLDSRIEATL
jgi:hypothetical protein